MKTKTVILSLALLCVSVPLLADDDCDDPVANWQPRENLRQKLESEGWTVYRIKVDDGCYEAKGRLSGQYKVEASFSPAFLTLMKLELEREDMEGEDDFDSSYGKKMRGAMPGDTARSAPCDGTAKGRPRVTVE